MPSETAIPLALALAEVLSAHFALTYKQNADVYAVQGYDAAQLLGAGLAAVKGDFSKRDALQAAMRKATVDSPRGRFTLSAAGNPVQDMYLREAKGENNEYRAVAAAGGFA